MLLGVKPMPTKSTGHHSHFIYVVLLGGLMDKECQKELVTTPFVLVREKKVFCIFGDRRFLSHRDSMNKRVSLKH